MENDFKQIAAHHQVSVGVVETLAQALQIGHGKAAQFNHPELGGSGQWMPGMVMISDMNNLALKATVDSICRQLLTMISDTPTQPSRPVELTNLEEALEAPTKPVGFSWARLNLSGWWPQELGAPDASGGQNDMDYAYFATQNRLVVRANNKVKIYDTHGYDIIGVSQQHKFGRKRLIFNCQQQGQMPLDKLPAVE